MSKASRDKGARFERWVKNRINSIGLRARRTLLSGAFGDGDVASDLRDVIECKHNESLNENKAVEQAGQPVEYEATDLQADLMFDRRGEWVLISKRNGRRPLARLDFDRYLTLAIKERAYDLGDRS